MSRVAFDTNVHIYAEMEPTAAKGIRARQVVLRAARNGVICAQVLAESLRYVQRVDPARLGRALAFVDDYLKHFAAPPTTVDVPASSGEIVRAHGLLSFDAIIVVASAGAGATVLLSEDMQDGRAIGGLRILNPFAPENAAAVDALFPA